MANEIISKRTVNSKTYDIGGGEYRLEAFMYPIHFKNDSGEWEDIDISVKSVNAWEFTGAVMKNVFHAYFYDDTDESNRHLASFEIVGDDEVQRWINFKLKNANPTGGWYKENRYVFPDCFENVDVEYITTEDKLKENIVLRSYTDMREFTFTVKSFGISLFQDEDGSVFLDSGEDRLAFLDHPFMEDAEGNTSEGVKYILGSDGEFDTVTVQITDEEFLSNAVYPINVDPTIIIDDKVVASTVRMDRANNQNLGVRGTGGNGTSPTNSAIYFTAFDDIVNDFKNNPAGNVLIRDAYMEIYEYYGETDSSRKSIQGARVGIVTTPWTNGALPAVGIASIMQINSATYLNKWVRINLKPYINDKFQGVRFDAWDSNCSATYASPFYSTASLRPKVAVQWIVKPILAFHDGTGDTGLYGDASGNIFKYLDFGTIQAGMTTPPQIAYLRNYSTFDVKNTKITLVEDLININPYVHVELSKTQNPFVAEDVLEYNGVFANNSDLTFYIRVISDEPAQFGGNYNIKARAEPL